MVQRLTVGVITQEQGAHLGLYLGALASIEEVESVVLADSSGQTFSLAQKTLGSKLAGTYRDTGELLRKASPQMALVTLEADRAPRAIDAALEAGCHVLAEKPSCIRAQDFEPLVRKAQSKHRHLMLALANRVAATVQEARRLVHEGKIGKVYGAEIHIIADQTRLKQESYRKAWFSSKARAGGGHLIWLGIHWLDLTLFITSLHVEQVTGFAGIVGGQPIDVEDSANLALRFDKGAFGTMTSAYYLDHGYHQHIQIWGEHGWLRLEEMTKPMAWYSTNQVKRPAIQTFDPGNAPAGYTPFVRAAVRASAGLQPPPITGEECLHVLKAIFAFYEAAKTGRAQKV